MIYLISQMILALAVAVVLGMALGWLLHRTTYNRQSHRLKQTIAKQNARLAQAQSDVTMLTDDYDEMHRQTQDQIIALREENRQIPTLSSNLEKSQLLVRQMMQRHEAKVHEINNENRKLSSRLAKIEAQEQTKNQLAAGLDQRRRQSAETQADITKSDKADAKSPQNTNDASATDRPPNTSDTDSSASTRLSSAEHGEFKASQPALFVAAESEADPFDQVIEVADELQRELDLTAERKLAALEVDASCKNDESDTSQADSNEPATDNDVRLTSDSRRHNDLNLMAVRLDADAPDSDSTYNSIDLRDLPQDTGEADDLDNLIDLDDIGDLTDNRARDNNDTLNQTDDLDDLARSDDTLDSTGQTSQAGSLTGSELHGASTETDNPDHAGDQTDNGELELDGGGDESTLFVPVNQHDDLQQIFGIGPLTEQALNELGITSYSQLAELKHHEIQRIADALNIGPGRIERDNWVGNARRQLEEVLEQL